MSLDRFKTAQASPESGYAVALAELRAGRKTSHWIWYVLPQLASLGRSPTAQFYGLADLAEARAYLADPQLGPRLHETIGVIAAQLAAGVPLLTLLGSTTDCGKLVSCLTLFRLAATHPGHASAAGNVTALASFTARCDEVLAVAERQGFPPCATTLAQAQRA